MQNGWKCTVFSHLHLKYAKSAIMTQKKFILKNINMGSQKTQNFMLISNSLVPLTKVKSKNPQKNAQKRKHSKSHSFLALAFFRGISLSRHQRIWNQHKILRFLIPIFIFSKKNILGHNSPFDSHQVWNIEAPLKLWSFPPNRAPKMRERHQLFFGLRLVSKEFQHPAALFSSN